MEKHDIIIALARQVIQALYDGDLWNTAINKAVATAPIAVKASEISTFVEILTR